MTGPNSGLNGETPFYTPQETRDILQKIIDKFILDYKAGGDIAPTFVGYQLAHAVHYIDAFIGSGLADLVEVCK